MSHPNDLASIRSEDMILFKRKVKKVGKRSLPYKTSMVTFKTLKLRVPSFIFCLSVIHTRKMKIAK